MPYRRAENNLPAGHGRDVGMAASGPHRARKCRARARLSRASVAGVALAAGALAGCGGSGGTASTSSASTRGLEVTSPALTSRQTLPAQYTCSGRNIFPPLAWGHVPANTAELALFLLDLGHTQEASGGRGLEAKLIVGWSVRGLAPTLRELAAGRLPAGATTGPGRYSICPPKGGTGQYMFRLYALPKRLSVTSKLSDLELFRKINRSSLSAGYVLANYTRPRG
jgi:phosphatidylethanolamine-binding protein (PEBP) family uncharacterized protein